MPVYKMEGKKNGLQKYRVRINYTDNEGKAKQLDRVAYGMEVAKALERQLNFDLKEETIKKLTIGELYDEFMEVKKHEVRESTLINYEMHLNKYVMNAFKNYRTDKLNMQMLQKWKTSIEDYSKENGEGLSLNTKRLIFRQFTSLLNYAVKMEYISKNYLNSLGNFKDACEMKKEISYYTPEEFLKFISASREEAENTERNTGNINEWNYYVFFNIAFYTGLRKGEIYALKWTDIENNILYVRRNIQQKLCGKDRELPPKNKSSIRSLQMPEPLIKVLEEHYKRYKEIDGFSDDYRICGGIRCIRDSTVNLRRDDYADLAGVKRIRIHDFRHSHASLLANSGINIQEVARRLGHAKIEITWNIYSHIYPREEERAIEILNKIV